MSTANIQDRVKSLGPVVAAATTSKIIRASGRLLDFLEIRDKNLGILLFENVGAATLEGAE